MVINNKDLYFDLANEYDIEGIMEIEENFFQSGVAYKKEDIIKWMNYNPNMFYVVRDSEGRVKAFTIIAPITEECYKKFKSGIITDMNEFELSDIMITLQSDYYYFADVASKQKDAIAAMILFNNILPIIWENTHYVVTTPITDAGRNKARKLGAKNSNGEELLTLNVPCYIEVASSKEKAQRLIEQAKKILARQKK